MVSVLGVQFTDMGEADVATACARFMEDDTPHIVVTAGPEFVMRVRGDEGLRAMLAYADLVTPDGIGIVVASRWYGQPLRERVTGVELTERLLAIANGRGWRVYMLGATPQSCASALAKVRDRFPRVQLGGRHGYFSSAETDEVLRDIRAFAPHLLLVGLGQPRQERFIFEHREYLRVPLSIGIGGTIDILSGHVRRAPTVFRRAHAEWLYRLLSQPTRAARQLALPRFAVAAWRDARRERKTRGVRA
ncbi:MAG: WecB/TagA/CpsF family glycosyltransferase [Firmicutes bacterium]|nr:WecB/TagA/CpsF family glycosyltransferase [Bacillota bacterium]